MKGGPFPPTLTPESVSEECVDPDGLLLVAGDGAVSANKTRAFGAGRAAATTARTIQQITRWRCAAPTKYHHPPPPALSCAPGLGYGRGPGDRLTDYLYALRAFALIKRGVPPSALARRPHGDLLLQLKSARGAAKLSLPLKISLRTSNCRRPRSGGWMWTGGIAAGVLTKLPPQA